MDKNKIIKSVKRQEEEKVAVSLKLPASLKFELQKVAERESISMNSLIVATLHSFIDDDCGKALREAQSLLFSVYGYMKSQLEHFEYTGVDGDNYAQYAEVANIVRRIDQMREEQEK